MTRTCREAAYQRNGASPVQGQLLAQLPQTPDTMDMMHEAALQHIRHGCKPLASLLIPDLGNSPDPDTLAALLTLFIPLDYE